jgi:hypothetical protein
VPDPKPVAGRLHANGWASIDLQGGAQVWVRRAAQWEVRAARRDGWQIEYVSGQSTFPQSVRLISDTQTVNVDLATAISDVEANVDLRPEAFQVDVPGNASPLTLEELRESGPLRAK